MSDVVLLTIDAGIAIITLNRPEVRNAFGSGMGAALSEALCRCDEMDDVRVIVLTGSPPAFCAGADMHSGGDPFAATDEATFSAAALHMPPWKVRKLVIAAVN